MAECRPLSHSRRPAWRELPTHPQFEPNSGVRFIKSALVPPLKGGLFPIKSIQNPVTFGAAYQLSVKGGYNAKFSIVEKGVLVLTLHPTAISISCHQLHRKKNGTGTRAKKACPRSAPTACALTHPAACNWCAFDLAGV